MPKLILDARSSVPAHTKKELKTRATLPKELRDQIELFEKNGFQIQSTRISRDGTRTIIAAGVTAPDGGFFSLLHLFWDGTRPTGRLSVRPAVRVTPDNT